MALKKKPSSKKEDISKIKEHTSLDSFNSLSTLKVGGKNYQYFSLLKAEKNGLAGIERLPYTLKILLENILRHEDGRHVKAATAKAFTQWLTKGKNPREISTYPARVLLQDFTGVPAVVDLTAMRDAMKSLGTSPQKIDPLIPIDLVIDHSLMVDHFGTQGAFKRNVDREYQRNGERYKFLRWGAQAFDNFRVVPPGTGICHQVNLEYLGQTVCTKKVKSQGKTVTLAYPDTMVGADSHTTMINALSVLGWGVGGIEAEAAMLGQPLSILIPEVVGFHIKGKLKEGVTATDLVLTATQMLRNKGVVGKFVEFCGSGLDNLSLEDRATLSNMAPEYGATCGFFAVDKETLRYLKATGRSPSQVALVEKYARAQGMFRTSRAPLPVFTDTLTLDLATVRPSLAGPKRPQDKVLLNQVSQQFSQLASTSKKAKAAQNLRVKVQGRNHTLGHGDVVIAAITSCTNTSNPSVMVGAGLVARNAVEKGLRVPPWVKTSLAPGSQVVTDYLQRSGLQKYLNKLGFDLVGYGCTTCIGNSGPLPTEITKAVQDNDLTVASVLSGNRNFEGRINADIRANYLASPMLVVAYALAGSVGVDITKQPLGYDKKGQPVMLKDIWPSSKQIASTVRRCLTPAMFRKRYSNVFSGDSAWKKIKVPKTPTYTWSKKSTYVQEPPFFKGIKAKPVAIKPLKQARILGLFGDSITTDHISPAGSIQKNSPAGKYLTARKVAFMDFNSYGARRGNHEVMMRGTFANVRLKNLMVPDTEGGVTKVFPGGKVMPIYDAAMVYAKSKTPLVIFAGKEYGTGSSRDWAAKGPQLLGVRAVIAQSYERIHRSNLIGMGIVPLQFTQAMSWQKLKLTGMEKVTVHLGLKDFKPRALVKVTLSSSKGKARTITTLCRIDTGEELEYFENGGILPYVLRQLATA